jgi:superfamily II DNA/RNA helicase
MLDMGFLPDVERICAEPRANARRALSATLPTIFASCRGGYVRASLVHVQPQQLTVAEVSRSITRPRSHKVDGLPLIESIRPNGR